MQEQLQTLPAILRDDERRAATLLRKICGRIHAYQVAVPGKVRCRIQLRVRLNAWEVLREAMGDNVPPGLWNLISPGGGDASFQEFVLDLDRTADLGYRVQKAEGNAA